MTPPPEPPPPRSARLPLALGLAFLALVEATWLTGRYDTSLLRETSPWGTWLAASRLLLPVGVTVLAAVLLFARRSLSPELRARFREPLRPGRREALLLVLHAASFAAFAGLTEHVFSGDLAPTASLALVWSLQGLVCAASLLFVVVPSGLLRALARESLAPAGAGVLVGVVAYAAGSSTDRTLWTALGRPTLRATAGLLDFLGVPSTADPGTLLLETPTFAVEIGVGCSGYEGIGLLWIFLSVYLWLFRHELRFPRALLLLPLGTCLVWCANVLRIAVLMLVGEHVSPELAIGAFHTRFGWVLFTLLSLGLAALGRRSTFLRRGPDGEAGSPDPALAFLAPLAALTGTGLVVSTLAPAGSPWLGLAMLAGLLCVLALRHRHDEEPLALSPRALGAGILVFLVWTLFEGSPEHLVSWPPREELSLRLLAVVRILGFVCVVPWIEELAFRGYLMRRLQSEDVLRVPPGSWSWVALLSSSLFFGLVHERWIVATAAGLVYGLVYVRSRRLGEAVCAHGTTNALLVLRQVFLG